MSGLVKHERHPIIRGESPADVFRKKCDADRLSVWAEEVQKNVRTVRRYAQTGVIPNAYQTKGKQWRAPFTSQAVESVQHRLRVFSRASGPRLTVPGSPYQHEEQAWLLTVAYALLLAYRRNRLAREAHLLLFYRRVLFGLANPVKSKRIQRAQEKWPDWKCCVTLTNRLGVRMTALVAAYALAFVELWAESKNQAHDLFEKGRFLRFGHSAKGEIGVSGRTTKQKGTQRRGDDGQSSRIRKQVITLAKSPVSLRSVIQKWQWIMGQRSIKNAKDRGEILTGYPGHSDRSYVHLPKRYYSRRTFYNWFKNEDRKRAFHEAGILLLSSQQETKEQSECEDS